MKKICSFLLVAICISCHAQPKNKLDVQEFAKGILVENSQLLDVRTLEEYNSGHIENTLWADWNNDTEFERRTAFLNKNNPLYVYCLSGGRSASAAKALRSKGFSAVFELNGGINAWKASKENIIGKESKKEMTIAEYNSIIDSNKIVLVDFGATWCPPCKLMEPIISRVEATSKIKFTVLKVDGGNDEDVMQLQKVTALPVFIVYKNGKETWRKNGIATEAELLNAINN